MFIKLRCAIPVQCIVQKIIFLLLLSFGFRKISWNILFAHGADKVSWNDICRVSRCTVQCVVCTMLKSYSSNSDVPSLCIVQKRKLGLWMSSAQRWIKTRSRTTIIALDLLIFLMISTLLCQGKVFHVFLDKTIPHCLEHILISGMFITVMKKETFNIYL